MTWREGNAVAGACMQWEKSEIYKLQRKKVTGKATKVQRSGECLFISLLVACVVEVRCSFPFLFLFRTSLFFVTGWIDGVCKRNRRSKREVSGKRNGIHKEKDSVGKENGLRLGEVAAHQMELED